MITGSPVFLLAPVCCQPPPDGKNLAVAARCSADVQKLVAKFQPLGVFIAGLNAAACCVWKRRRENSEGSGRETKTKS